MNSRAAKWVAGFDEVGRGCIGGSVIASAVILPEDPSCAPLLRDSKQLSPAKRESLAKLIKSEAIAWSIGRAEPGEIDRINILQASLLAMQRAYKTLKITPHLCLIDGNHSPVLPCETRAIIGGDGTVPVISAASILAKTYRDHEMQALDLLFPGYGFSTHKGYPTAAHLTALAQQGPCPIHRRSFAPVRNISGSKPA